MYLLVSFFCVKSNFTRTYYTNYTQFCYIIIVAILLTMFLYLPYIRLLAHTTALFNKLLCFYCEF